MQYLQQLKDDLIENFSDVLTAENVHLFIVNGEYTANSGYINYVARLLFIDCRKSRPFDLLTYISWWFDNQKKEVPGLNFDSEIIDAETYDLTIDIGLSDKVVVVQYNGSAHVCPPKVWSDTFADWVAPDVASLVDVPEQTKP